MGDKRYLYKGGHYLYYIMASDKGVYQRKPFQSGGSKVITVTGMPVIPTDGRLNIKPIHLDGKECLLISSYSEIPLYEMENMESEISTDTELGETLTTQSTVHDMVSYLSKNDINIPSGKKLVLSLADR